MIPTSPLNRDVVDFYGKWESDHSLSVFPKSKRSDPKTGTAARATDMLESVKGTRARQRSMSVMLKKKGVLGCDVRETFWLFPRGPGSTRVVVSVSSGAYDSCLERPITLCVIRRLC